VVVGNAQRPGLEALGLTAGVSREVEVLLSDIHVQLHAPPLTPPLASTALL
jgi:hypothetical protein